MSEIKLVKKTMEDFSKEQFEKLITEHATYKSLVEILQNQLQQKENIIKEVREWLERTIFYFDFEKEVTSHTFELLYTAQGQELSMILDKGE